MPYFFATDVLGFVGTNRTDNAVMQTARPLLSGQQDSCVDGALTRAHFPYALRNELTISRGMLLVTAAKPDLR